jgi:hypothetical protein
MRAGYSSSYNEAMMMMAAPASAMVGTDRQDQLLPPPTPPSQQQQLMMMTIGAAADTDALRWAAAQRQRHSDPATKRELLARASERRASGFGTSRINGHIAGWGSFCCCRRRCCIGKQNAIDRMLLLLRRVEHQAIKTTRSPTSSSVALLPELPPDRPADYFSVRRSVSAAVFASLSVSSSITDRKLAAAITHDNYRNEPASSGNVGHRSRNQDGQTIIRLRRSALMP